MTIIYAIIIFLLLIFVHEFGHFIAAKACGVKVNEFSLGMGPAILKKQGRETLYAWRLVPIGGYCAMEGETEDSDHERALNKKNGWQKLIVFAAGSLMNIVLCVILMIIMNLASGVPSTTIDEVLPDGPAAAAGMKAGDEIVAIDGRAADKWEDITGAIDGADGPLTFTVKRGDETTEITVPVEYNEDEQRSIVGITSALKKDPAGSVAEGFKSTGRMLTGTAQIIGMMFTGRVSVKDLSGPVGIVTAVNESSKRGLMYIIYLTAFISLNLALVNLLPFPALDGGRIVFLGIRKVTGKRVTDRVENGFHMAGFVLLLALMVYVTFNDIGRLM